MAEDRDEDTRRRGETTRDVPEKPPSDSEAVSDAEEAQRAQDRQLEEGTESPA